MSAEKKVITIKGEEVNISKCRKFNKKWYKVGLVEVENSGDCYLINNSYFRVETGLLVYNHSIKRYVIKDSSLLRGVVNVLDKDVIIGYFSDKNNHQLLIDCNKSTHILMDVSILNNNKMYRERLSTGNFYHISVLEAKKFNSILVPLQEYKYSLPYDSSGIINENLEKYNSEYNPEILPNINKYSKLLGDLTFGLEFETTRGFIPKRILDNFGLIPLRDGSISGIEYVTVPMSGEKGLQCSYDILKSLEERTKYDDNSCSLHLHIGNIPRTKEFILAFMKLAMFVQDEMFSMFPIYKKYNFSLKNKNYSAPLPSFEILSQLDSVINSDNLNHNFGVLYKHLSMGQDFKAVDFDLNKVKSHPADPSGQHKWQVKTRYYMMNIIPLIFGNKKTIEFRIHTPTYEVNKIIPFILMNSMLVNFAIEHQNSILSNSRFFINLDIFSIISSKIDSSDIENKGKINEMFSDYISLRKRYVERQIREGNILGDESKIPYSRIINWSTKDKDDYGKNLYEAKISSFKYNIEQIKSLIKDDILLNNKATIKKKRNYDSTTF